MIRASDFEPTDWRSTVHDSGISVEYKKRFSFIPKKISGKLVWLKPYYSEYLDVQGHVDHVRDYSEEEFIVVKLTREI